MEDKIEIGEYIRVNNNFRKICIGIGKVTRVDNKTIYAKMNINLPVSFKREDIVKNSKNIKDLVQAGDIVKYKINGLNKEKIREVKSYVDTRSRKENLIIEGYKLEQVEILEILTKEQFEANSFKVGDNFEI